MPLGRRYRADRHFEKPRLRGDWSTDTLDGCVVLKAGNRYGQVFANKSYFAAIYPMDSKGKAGEALRVFCHYVPAIHQKLIYLEHRTPDKLLSVLQLPFPLNTSDK